MTREEIIEAYESAVFSSGLSAAAGNEEAARDYELLKAGLNALRPVSREQVEKVWRGCPECKPRCGLCVHMGQWDKYGKPYVCEKCVGFSNFESDQKFCECCGRPLTDEAVQMVMERLEATNDKLEESC